jgi:hypothetical protein
MNGICDYGCGQKSNFTLKNGKECCCKSANSCKGKKRTNRDQSGEKNCMFGKKPWNFGLKKEDDDRIKLYSEKSKETRSEKVRTGEWSPWNKGLTKEDPRVLKNALATSKAKKGIPNPKNRVPINKSLSKTAGAFRNLFKKGLYSAWVFPILKRDNFTCVLCHKTKCKLEVHHLIPYQYIFAESLSNLGLNIEDWEKYDEETLQKLHELVLKKHRMKFGVTVCFDCHCDIDPHRRKFKKKDTEGEENVNNT